LRAKLPFINLLENSLSDISKNMPTLNRMLYLEQKHYLADHTLNYTDKMSMAAGVEVRVPLLDPDLVELAARLPIQYKQRGKEGKWIFKKAMEGILPNDIIYRPKTGFGAPIRAWIHGPLKKLVRDILSESSINNRKWFDAKAVTRLLNEDETGKIDASYSIFALLCIELWARIFLDEDIVKC
jgi:asparagine synthase (glutamine-hydrolysing)